MSSNSNILMTDLNTRLINDEHVNVHEEPIDWLGRGIVQVMNHRDYIDKFPSIRKGCKVFICILSASSKVAFWAISTKVGDEVGGGKGLGIASALANSIAFAFLETHSGFGLVNDEIGPKTQAEVELYSSKNRNNFRKIILLAPSAIIAVLSQLPSGLAAAEYNGEATKVAYTALLMFSTSLFPLRSVQKTLDALWNYPRSNLIRKCFPGEVDRWQKFEEKVIAVKNDLCNQILANQSILLSEKQLEFVQSLGEVTSLTDIETQRTRYETSLLSYEAESNPELSKGQMVAMRVGQLVGWGVGSIFLLNIGDFTYSLTNRYTNNEGISVTAGITAPMCIAYLTQDIIPRITSSTFLKAYNLGSKVLSGCKIGGYKDNLRLSEKLRPNLTNVIYISGIIVDVLSLGATIVVYGDFDDKTKGEKVAGATIMASGLFFILFNSMLVMLDDLILILVASNGSEEENKIIQAYYKLNELNTLFKKSSCLDIAIYLSNLPPELKNTMLSKFDISFEELSRYVSARINKRESQNVNSEEG